MAISMKASRHLISISRTNTFTLGVATKRVIITSLATQGLPRSRQAWFSTKGTGHGGSEDVRARHMQADHAHITNTIHDKKKKEKVTRKTGDEVEEARDPVSRAAHRVVINPVMEGVKKVKEVVVGREDPIVSTSEEAIDSVPKFKEGRQMQAQRGKEKLAGSLLRDDRQGRQIGFDEGAASSARASSSQTHGGKSSYGSFVENVMEKGANMAHDIKEKVKEGAGPVVERAKKKGAKVAHDVKETVKEGPGPVLEKAKEKVQHGVERGKESLHSVKEKIKAIGEHLEDSMTGKAEEASKRLAKGYGEGGDVMTEEEQQKEATEKAEEERKRTILEYREKGEQGKNM